MVRASDVRFCLLLNTTSTSMMDISRETWLLPCKAAPSCDYRFFVDKLDTTLSEV